MLPNLKQGDSILQTRILNDRTTVAMGDEAAGQVETIQNLYNLLRAVVFKYGRDVELTKEEFLESLGTPLSISHFENVTYLRIWNVCGKSRIAGSG